MFEIEVGKYYKTRNGRKVGPITEIKRLSCVADMVATDGLEHWFMCGRKSKHVEYYSDIVSEWSDSPTRTVTRREIVDGEYSGIHVANHEPGSVLLGFEVCGDVHMKSFNAEQLSELIHIASQIREVLEDGK